MEKACCWLEGRKIRDFYVDGFNPAIKRVLWIMRDLIGFLFGKVLMGSIQNRWLSGDA